MSNQALRNLRTLSRCQQRHDAKQPPVYWEDEDGNEASQEEPDYSGKYDAMREERGLDTWA